MVKTNIELLKELDLVVDKDIKEIVNLQKMTDVKIISFKIQTKLDEKILVKYNLNDDIRFIIDVTPDSGIVSYYYKGLKLNPDCYYLRPDEYYSPTVLDILQECIRQDTHIPDIKFLERGDKLKRGNRLKEILSEYKNNKNGRV